MRRALSAVLLCAACSSAGRAPAPELDGRPRATAAKSSTADAAPPVPSISVDEAEALLYLSPRSEADTSAIAACRAAQTTAAAITCLLAARYAKDAAAAAIAHDLYATTGDVAGLLPEEDFDGGYRGVIHLVPELPTRALRKHLQWVADAMRDIDALFAGLDDAARKATRRYRWRALSFRFYRSLRKPTPAAFAIGWLVSYNVAGKINTSADVVRETLFHEIFHLNDADHGDWSAKLEPLFSRIVDKCGTARRCLAPYAPGDTTVIGGTYYAFQPGNGVGEYAAELALRYYREQREMLHAQRLSRAAFKCGPPENAQAWQALVDEFFGGVDLVPACGR